VVLVVDDEAGIRDVLADLLAMEGYEVLTAANGQQGLEAYQEGEPDLVITDIMMPKMNGVDMVLQLRTRNPKVNVIFMSGFFGASPSRRDMTDAIATFGYPLVHKPFKPTDFLSQVHSTLSLNGV
jgi:OmpR family response regulator RpaB